MKKTFTILIAAIAAILMMAQPTKVWADNNYTIGWGTASGDAGTYTNFTGENGQVTGVLSFSTDKNSSQNNPAYNSNSSELRLYYASNGDGGSITIEPASGVTITGFVMTTSTTPSVNYTVNGGTATSVSASNSTYTVSDISATTSLEIQNVNTSNTQLRIKTIQITYTVAAPSYTITAQSNNDSYGTVSLSGNVITGAPNSGYRYASPAYSVSPANSATVSQNGNAFTVTPSANTTVTINFEAIPCYTVTYSDGGSVTETTGGAGVTLATRSAIGSYEFVGWSTTEVATETTTAPTIISTSETYYPTANITLYPVYAKAGGGAATPSPFSVGDTGDYAIVSAEQNGKYYALPTNPTVTNGKITAEEITVTETDGVKYVTTSDASGFTWTIAAAINGYTLSDGSKYIYHSNGGASGTNVTYGTGTTYTWAFTEDGNYITMAGMSGSTTNSRGMLFQGTTIGGYALSNAGNSGYYKVMILPISAGSTTYYWSSPVAATVEQPVITVGANPFLFSTTATIACATEGASIKYSYNNSTWNDYSSALTITETTTIYTKAIKDENESTVASVEVTKNLATPTVTVSGDLTLDLDGGANVAAGILTASVTYANASVDGATVSWSSNHTNIAEINASGAVTIKAVGEVTFTATYAGNGDYAEATGTKTVTVTDSQAPGAVGNPYTVAQARAAIDAGTGITDVYATGIVKQIVTAYDSEHGNVTFDIVDAVGDEAYLRAYRCGGNDAAYVAVGDVVVVSGSMTLYNNLIYEFIQGCQIVSRTPHQAQQYTLAVTSVTNAEIFVFDATDPDDNNWVSLFDGEDAAQVTEGTPIALSVSADQGYAITELMVYGVNHVADIVDDLYTFNMPAQDVTITVTAVRVYNITYSKNGVEIQAQVLSTTLTLPTADDLDSEFTFAGWTTTPANIGTPMAAGAQVTIQGDEIFYAVYARIEGREAYYEKVTENLQDWRGNYLIVQEYESVAFDGSLTELDDGHNVIGVTISNGIINSDDDVNGSIFTIDTYENGYSIQSASGYYIGKTAYSNGLNSSDATAYENTISYNDENECVNILGSASNTVALRFNNASGVSNYRFRYYKDYSQQPIQLYKEVVVSLGTTTYYTRVFVDETVTDKVTITGPSIIPSGSTLNMAGYELSSATAANLIIEDGGQLILANDKSVAATVKKTIEAPEDWADDNTAGWYAISSPVGNIAPSDVTNMVLPMVSSVPQYDLYKYVENMGWYNAQASTQSIATLEKGHGYLYARSANESLSYAGNVTSAAFDIENLSKSGVKHSGLHLIGNPYTHDIYLGIAITGDLTTTGYYALNASGSWISTANTTPIKPEQAVFVFVTTDDATISFNNATGASKAHHDYIRFNVANSQYEDVAYAMFDKGNGLSKIEHRNSEAPMIYIPQNDDNYAIAVMDDNTQMFGLNFKAATTGRYTLNFDTKGEYSYLHVIDRLTGADTDMLLEGEYSFIGTPNDNDNRFVVKLAYKPDYSEGNSEIFAFQSGNDIFVSGEGELQVYDVMGRFVMSECINGATSISADALSKGVYVLRIVGSEIKTQKIVVR